MKHSIGRAARAAALGLAASAALSGCAPLLIGGALFGGALVMTDRRTSGTILEDEAIEVKAAGRIREAIGDRGSIGVNSYNRVVLLTGDVPTEADKERVGQIVAKVENVQSVVNELVVGFDRSITGRSKDALITSKVKASFIDAKDLFSNSIKVVTSHDVVYLMGRITEREAHRATEVARGVDGVRKVVRVFEIIPESELAKQIQRPAAASAPAR